MLNICNQQPVVSGDFMYGIINNAVRELVVKNFGEQSWDNIIARVGCPHHEFNTLEPMRIKTTYDLVSAASEELGVTPEEVLHLFGKHWVGYTQNNGYGVLMDMFGHSFIESLKSKPVTHENGFSMLVSCVPQTSEYKKSSMMVRCFWSTTRLEGLSNMVVGLLESMAQKIWSNC